MMKVFTVLFFVLFLAAWFTVIAATDFDGSLLAFAAGMLLVPAVCAVLDR